MFAYVFNVLSYQSVSAYCIGLGYDVRVLSRAERCIYTKPMSALKASKAVKKS